MNKVLVVVDMQNDFIDGSLANPTAQAIVYAIANYVSTFEGLIVFTRDTHDEDYLNTREGKNIPIPHCIAMTDGWEINQEIHKAAEHNPNAQILKVNKPTFSAGAQLMVAIKTKCESPDEIQVCGTCTDICVVSNALALVGLFDKANIVVLADLCAGSTGEKHEAALEVMQSCQISVVNSNDRLREFVHTWVKEYNYLNARGTLSDRDAYDVGYDLKPDIEESMFNRAEKDDFDDWYDLFLEDEIIPILVELGAIYEENHS